MPKDLSLMQVTALVPTAKVHQACAWLEDNGATSMMVRAYRNGATPPPEKIGKTGQVAGQDNKQRGANQQQWLADHIKGDVRTKDLMERWLDAGFNGGSIYSALARAVKDKQLKKVRAGVYRRAG